MMENHSNVVIWHYRAQSFRTSRTNPETHSQMMIVSHLIACSITVSFWLGCRDEALGPRHEFERGRAHRGELPLDSQQQLSRADRIAGPDLIGGRGQPPRDANLQGRCEMHGPFDQRPERGPPPRPPTPPRPPPRPPPPPRR